jgi:hypothetical protein
VRAPTWAPRRTETEEEKDRRADPALDLPAFAAGTGDAKTPFLEPVEDVLERAVELFPAVVRFGKRRVGPLDQRAGEGVVHCG